MTPAHRLRPATGRAISARAIAGASALLLALAALAGCAPSSASDYTGTWTSDHPAGTSLDLKDGGQLSGNDGCNSLTGTWSESKGSITFGALATTKKACADVDPWLSKAASARSDGDTLNVYDEAGTQIGVLDRT
ncbi:META domain-containing protein [Cryocola sp. 340MFSha3.1]|uniref:META domain-containing protein n=1 Tax=Cryocola sp. 340MFSha3.1 TaxID=1169145 RepID=UPI0003732012|nr:META domain-containing protein [Cryocola sp. 340MFSha3.1]